MSSWILKQKFKTRFESNGSFCVVLNHRAEIQRVYRGFKGRLRAKARRRVFESDLGREAAAMAIGRVFRGHKAGCSRNRFMSAAGGTVAT